MLPSIILFDGVCNLCNGAVNFIIQRDKKGIFKFASLQSNAAQQVLQGHGHFKKFDSIVLIENGMVFKKSAAALKIVKHLPWHWQWMQVFWMVPRPLRDVVYDVIAKNRYRWFGKKEQCMVPTPEVRNRFLD